MVGHLVRDPLDLIRDHAGDVRYPLGAEVGKYPVAERLESLGSIGDERLIEPGVSNQDVREAEGQCRVGAGPGREPLVGSRGGHRQVRADSHHLAAPPGATTAQMADASSEPHRRPRRLHERRAERDEVVRALHIVGRKRVPAGRELQRLSHGRVAERLVHPMTCATERGRKPPQ